MYTRVYDVLLVTKNEIFTGLVLMYGIKKEYGSKPLGELVREIVGLDMNAAKAAFSEYLESNNLDSRQIYFVNQIVEYIVHNGMMKDLSVLQESPFTDQGSVVEIFTDLNVWMGIRGDPKPLLLTIISGHRKQLLLTDQSDRANIYSGTYHTIIIQGRKTNEK